MITAQDYSEFETGPYPNEATAAAGRYVVEDPNFSRRFYNKLHKILKKNYYDEDTGREFAVEYMRNSLEGGVKKLKSPFSDLVEESLSLVDYDFLANYYVNFVIETALETSASLKKVAQNTITEAVTDYLLGTPKQVQEVSDYLGSYLQESDVEMETAVTDYLMNVLTTNTLKLGLPYSELAFAAMGNIDWDYIVSYYFSAATQPEPGEESGAEQGDWGFAFENQPYSDQQLDELLKWLEDENRSFEQQYGGA
jgi:hypothetical protein